MNGKGGIFTLLIVILVSIIIFAPFVSTKKHSIVHSEVEALFENQSEVSVIVMVKDYDLESYASISGLSADKSKDEIKKDMIKSQRETVLNKLSVKEKSKGSKSISISSDYDLELTNTYSLVNGFAGNIKKSGLEKLRNDPNVLGIYPNREVKAILDTSVPLVNATNTWPLVLSGQNITGQGETICIIDTGVDYTHTSMGACTNNTFLNGTCSKVIGGYDYVNSDNDPMDDHNHGTHVAGIAASTNETYKGVAPDARIVALKVLDSSGSGLDADVISGINWCVNNASLFNISVISMSLGGSIHYNTYCDASNTGDAQAIDAAIARNIPVIIATGNKGNTSAIAAPACINNATAVSSTTKADAFSSFSDRGNITDLLAPGSSIVSLLRGGGTTTSSGTSMATPHVSGAFALIRQFGRLERNINFTPSQILDFLNKTGKRINDSGESDLIYTRINIFSAARYIANVTVNFSTNTEGNGTSTNRTWIFINVTMNTSNFANITYSLYYQNGTSVNTTTYTISNESNKRINFTPVNFNTIYLYNVTVYDTSTFSNSTETRQVTLINTGPGITYSTNTEANNSYLNRNWIFINVSININSLANITYYLMNSSFGIINSTTYTTAINTTNFTVNASNVVYYFNVSITDTLNQVNYTENRIVTLDNITPSLNFSTSSDANNSFITKGWIFLNVTASDTNFQNITFYLYNITNLLNSTTYVNLTEQNKTINFSLSNLNAVYFVNVTIADKAGNINSTETRRIINDVTFPSIAFASPTLGNNSYSSRGWMFVNISLNEFNFNNITYILTNSSFGIINSTLYTTATNTTNFTVNNSNTLYYIAVNISDRMNNVNITDYRLITLDTLFPSIDFSTGTENNATAFNKAWVFVNVSVTDTNFDNVSFFLYFGNGTLVNHTNYTTQNFTNFTSLIDANYLYNVTVFDRTNNQNTTAVRNITLDTRTPSVVFEASTATNNSITNRSWIFINVTVVESNLANITFPLYYLNLTLINETNYTILTNSINFSGLTDNTYVYNVTVRDKANNQNKTDYRIITLDTANPRITGISPANNSASIAINSNFTINFSENITSLTLSNINFILVDSRGFNITATFSYNSSNQSVIIPDIFLSYNETYNLTLKSGIYDLAGNNLSVTSFNFTTEANPFNMSNSIIGNLSFVNTNIKEINITINGSDAYNLVKNESLNVIISNKTDRFVEVNISFTSVKLDLTNITVRQNPNSSAGSLIVRGIPVFAGINKTIYLDNLTDLTGVCIKDADIININQISSNCKSQNETFIRCPGTFKQYGCELNGSRYKITGLAHSGITQANDTGAPIVTAISTSNSGSTITLSVTTDENATCKFDESDNSFASLTYTMTDTGTAHTGTRTYTSTSSGTYYVRCNDTAGNVMASSNTTSFSITISSGGSSSGGSSGGGGGGGGGGGTASATNKVQKFFDIIQPNTQVTFKVKSDELAITNVEFETIAVAEKVNIAVEKINDTKVPIKLDNVVQYLNFSTSNLEDSNIKLTSMEFKVSKRWLTENSFASNDIVMKRLVNNAWQNLPTSVLIESSFDYTYETITPGFSIFAISAEKKQKGTELTKLNETKPEQKENITMQEITTAEETKESNLTVQEQKPKEHLFKFKLSDTVIGILIAIVVIGLSAYFMFFSRRAPEYYIKRAEEYLVNAKEHYHHAKSCHSQELHEKSIPYHKKAAKHHRKVASHLRKIKQSYHTNKAERHEELAKHHEEIIKHIKDNEYANINSKLKIIDEKLRSL